MEKIPVFLADSGAVFAALWLLGTTGIYNDSNQYIAMHIHREPLYSFFLWIFRSLFGETKYLDIVRFLQNGLAAFSVIWLAESLKNDLTSDSGWKLWCA